MAVIWPIAVVIWCGAALVWCDAVPTNSTYIGNSDVISSNRLLKKDVPSRVMCAALCDRHASDCDGFTYDNGSCRLFSDTCATQTSNSTPETVVHVRHPRPKPKLSPCPDGWLGVQDYCYVYMPVRVNWHEADQRCADLQPGGRLAVIPNIDVWRALKAHFSFTSYVWIGVSDEASEGSFQSVDGSTPWLDWRTGEPDDKSHTQNCVLILEGEACDGICLKTRSFICRIPRKACWGEPPA